MSLIEEDEALIAAALNGSAYAWEKLVKRFESRVYNLGLRLTGNPTDALDLMQEVFLGVYRNLHRFRGDAKFSSWLFRIAHNKAVDMNRRKRLMTVQSRLTSEDEDEGFDIFPGDAREEPEHKLNEIETNQRIIRLLAKLPMEQRLVVELKIFQSLTFDEIALMQEISENTAKTRFYTALKKLKDIAEDQHVLS
ncbi:MAG: sigma-70 family RNA polymerase sigma factor [Gammaproteobacteria bacterium]|nr:sigma-70 family RNA polymerase sigma factor [Gammaproteobacteria bacterium]